MAVELKEYGNAYFVKDKALKKDPDLKALVVFTKAPNKSVAEAIAAGKLAEHYPANIDDYFKAKVWEHRADLPRIETGLFSTDFFDTVAVWDTNKGEPAVKPEADEKEEWQENKAQDEMKAVMRLDQTARATCLALFGPVQEITAPQYGQIIDLINDDAGGYTRELAEALAKETRSLALAPERQEQMLAWVRENAKESAQWPDIKKLIAKWIDAPADKRPQATSTSTSTSNVDTHTDTGTTLGGGNRTDRSPDLVHNLSTLRIEVAVAILSMYDEIDIYSIPNKFFIPAKAMSEAEQDTRFTAWWKQLRGTPGILDYSRAAIIALIKSAPEDIWLNPIELRQFINRELVESKHDKPDQKTIDIACRAKARTAPESRDHDETKSPVPAKTELPAVCPAKAAQLDKELNEAFAQNEASEQPRVENLGGGVFSVDAQISNSPSNEVEKTENRPEMSEREIEIAYALNDLMSGRTRELSLEESESDVLRTGHPVAHLIDLMITDIADTEFCLSPDFEIDEIQMVAACILDQWSDDHSERQKIALDAIVEYRRPEPPKSVVLDQPAVTAKPNTESEPAPETNAPVSSVTYLQQLTIAALQGLCSNPAYCNQYEELPAMAAGLARSVVSQQEVAE